MFDIGGAATLMGTGPVARTQPRPDRPVQMIELAAIVADSPYQTRAISFAPETFEEDRELLASIKLVGVLQPVGIQAIAKGFGQEQKQTYHLVFGHRRVQAAVAAGLEYVPALVYKPIDNTELLTLAENTGKRMLTSREKAMALAALRESHPELDVNTISERTGIPAPTVYQLLTALDKSVPALRELFAKSQWAPRSIMELQPVFNSIQSADDQSRFAAELDQLGPSYNQIVAIKTMVVEDHVDPFAALMIMSPKNGTARSAAVVFNSLGKPAETLATGQQVAETSEVLASTGDSQEPEDVAGLEERLEVSAGSGESDGRIADQPSASASSTGETFEPSSEDGKVIQSLFKTTGLAPAKIQKLAAQAVSENLSMDALSFACVVASKTGNEESALRLGRAAAANPAVTKLMKQYQSVFVKANSIVSTLSRSSETEELAGFVSTVFVLNSDGDNV
jgi:ParB/RepB/Spo0J family partition protein